MERSDEIASRYELTEHERYIRDTLSEDGDYFLQTKEWRSAEKVFQRLANDYPYDYRGWWGLVRLATKNFTDLTLDKQKIATVRSLYQRSVSSCSEPDAMKEDFSRYMSRLRHVASQNRSGPIRKNDYCEDERTVVERQLKQVNGRLNALAFFRKYGFVLYLAVTVILGLCIPSSRVRKELISLRMGILEVIVILAIGYIVSTLINLIFRGISKRLIPPLKEKRKLLKAKLSHLIRMENGDELDGE